MFICFLTFLAIICMKCESTPLHPRQQPKCIPVTAPVCLPEFTKTDESVEFVSGSMFTGIIRSANGLKKEQLLSWNYSYTTFPSFAGDKSESEVLLSFSELHMLLSTTCSKFIKLFLCAVHSPVCTSWGVVPPCRELCERVQSDCATVSNTFGIEWPEKLNCAHFPSTNVMRERVKKRNAQSADDAGNTGNLILVSKASTLLWDEALLDDGNICIPPSNEDVVTPALQRLERDSHNASSVNPTTSEIFTDYGVACPAEMRTPSSHSGFNFMGLPNCSAPCPNMYLNQDELRTVRYLVCVEAAVCVIVTSFALLTFAIDTKRFRYPERPIVFYALSYFVVSVVFLVGFGVGEQVACQDKIINEDNEILQGFAVVEGCTKRSCTVLFMVLYFFTVSGTIWWLILTITWLLAAGFKWGSEAIEKRWMYFHAVAWTVCSFQTVTVALWNKVEGDNVAGVCFVGLYDSDGLRFLLLAPISVYLIVGIVALLAGFFCLNRVMKGLENDEENRRKLAKFMLRIGVFSILFILPQIALIVVYVIEDINRKYWQASWYVRSCSRYAVPCPGPDHPWSKLAKGDSRPGVVIFWIKYTMMLIAALPPLFWVGSQKTFRSWAKFFSSQSWKHEEKKIGATHVHLLADSNGPHARDRDARLGQVRSGQTAARSATGLRSGTHGSPGTVAAAAILPSRSLYATQKGWVETTEDSSSLPSSSLSSIIAHDTKKNRGKRVVGRKPHHIPTKPDQVAGKAASNNSRQEDIVRCVESRNPKSSGLTASDNAAFPPGVSSKMETTEAKSKQLSTESNRSLNAVNDWLVAHEYEEQPTLEYPSVDSKGTEVAKSTNGNVGTAVSDKHFVPSPNALIVHLPDSDGQSTTATLSHFGSAASRNSPVKASSPITRRFTQRSSQSTTSIAVNAAKGAKDETGSRLLPDPSGSSTSNTLPGKLVTQTQIHFGDKKRRTLPLPPPRLESMSTTPNTEHTLSL